jgi:putative ABC transport system permease protein
MKFSRLTRSFILRNFRNDKFFNFLSIIGIALGIGLFIGVKVASDRAVISFEAAVDGLTPFANYEIHDISGIDFDENIYQRVRSIEEKSFPVVRSFGYIPDFQENVEILGTEISRISSFLNFPLIHHYEIEQFYREPGGILVTKSFSESHSLKEGDIIHPVIYDRQYALKITGILDTPVIYPSNLIMDIGNFQEYFSTQGQLSRIDIATDRQTASKIAHVLPSNLSLQSKEAVFAHRKAMIASFRHNLQFVSLVAILVGFFLLYNTVFISVVKRRPEIGILIGLGTAKKTVIALFAMHGLVLGFVGSLLGVLLGQVAAYFSVIAVEKTISTMYSTISISEYLVTVQDALIAIGLGLAVSLTASILPAFEASKVVPNESSREGTFEGKFRRYRICLFLAGPSLILAGIAAPYLEYTRMPFEFPLLSYAGILMIITGFTLISPLYLSFLLGVLRKPATRFFNASGKIAFGFMSGNPYRFSVALMSVAVSSALIIALFTLIFSFRGSLDTWIHKNIHADIYIKPASCTSNYCFSPFSDLIVSSVRKLPEVAGVDRFRALQVEVSGKKTIAGFGDTAVKRQHMSKDYKDKEYEKSLEQMSGNVPVAGISDFLSMKLGFGKGDLISIHTPSGMQSFTVNDVFASYSTTSGFIYLDRKWLKEYWKIDDVTQFSVYLHEGADIDRTIQKIRSMLSHHYSLEIMNNRELREKVIKIFDKSFAITYAIELICLTVSLIGIVNTLLSLVFERKREFSILRYLGASWKQLERTFLLSSAFIGASGIFLGGLMGPLMSVIFIYVVNKVSFGWKISFHVPFLSLFLVICILFLTALLSGLLPSKAAKKIDPRRFISFE